MQDEYRPISSQPLEFTHEKLLQLTILIVEFLELARHCLAWLWQTCVTRSTLGHQIVEISIEIVAAARELSAFSAARAYLSLSPTCKQKFGVRKIRPFIYFGQLIFQKHRARTQYFQILPERERLAAQF